MMKISQLNQGGPRTARMVRTRGVVRAEKMNGSNSHMRFPTTVTAQIAPRLAGWAASRVRTAMKFKRKKTARVIAIARRARADGKARHLAGYEQIWQVRTLPSLPAGRLGAIQ